jgi:hypothetical protein
MNFSCIDRERIFMDGAPEEWAALEQHAASCAECAEELRAWQSISVAARELRQEQEAPQLWPRIATALSEQAVQSAAREKRWAFLRFGWQLPVLWQTVFAGALVLALTLSGGYLYLQRQRSLATGNSARNPLLNDRAMAEVERTENAYMQAIDKLASEAKPRVDTDNSPLMGSYREKLLVLDSAIADLRGEAGQNPSNAHLRYQLLAMYREKQGTLQEILESKR